MHDQQPSSWTVDDSTQASNAGNLRANRFLWFQHYPLWPLIWFFTFVGLGLLGYFVHWGFYIPAVLFLLLNWLYWRRIREHFLHGCINPSVVVSLDPMLIAVATDLTKGLGSFPAVKIINKSLSTIGGQTPAVGLLLPTVALYAGDPNSEQPHWDDFDPRPVDCATNDRQEMQRMMQSIPQEEWDNLRNWLAKVPQPYQPGLFLIPEDQVPPAGQLGL